MTKKGDVSKVRISCDKSDVSRACYPSTISSGDFSLLCCQPEALHLSLKP